MKDTNDNVFLDKGIDECMKCGGFLLRYAQTRQSYLYRCEKCDAEFYWNKEVDLFDKENL
jgi:hypothetical protein